jgi:hypothetical protein
MNEKRPSTPIVKTTPFRDIERFMEVIHEEKLKTGVLTYHLEK